MVDETCLGALLISVRNEQQQSMLFDSEESLSNIVAEALLTKLVQQHGMKAKLSDVLRG